MIAPMIPNVDLNHSPDRFVPTPDEIRQRTAEIRAGWSNRVRRRRSQQANPSRDVPIRLIRMADIRAAREDQ